MSTKKETQIPEKIHCNLRLSSSARKTVGEVRERNMSNTTKAVQWIIEDYCRLIAKTAKLPVGKILTDQDVHEFFYGKT
jgi:hypothetical protein